MLFLSISVVLPPNFIPASRIGTYVVWRSRKRVPYNRVFRNRSEFETTFTELAAMAASDSEGCNKPNIATGIMTTL